MNWSASMGGLNSWEGSLLRGQQAKRRGSVGSGSGEETGLPIPVTPTGTDVDFPNPGCFQVEHSEMYLKLETATKSNQHNFLLSDCPQTLPGGVTPQGNS
jgi:hypothetical protein